MAQIGSESCSHVGHSTSTTRPGHGTQSMAHTAGLIHTSADWEDREELLELLELLLALVQAILTLPALDPE